VEVDGVRVYHAGDTDPLPEMEDLRPDIALLPVGGGPTMGWKAAAELVASLGARLAIPIALQHAARRQRSGKALFGSGRRWLPDPSERELTA